MRPCLIMAGLAIANMYLVSPAIPIDQSVQDIADLPINSKGAFTFSIQGP